MLFEIIVSLLREHHIDFVIKEHSPASTSEESARARNEPLKIGAKALLMKTKEEFVLVVLPADRRVDSEKVKAMLKTKNLRFAAPEELREKTGCEKGAVPPFGSVMGIRMIVDETLFEEEYMAFNAGLLDKSIKMKTADYRHIIKPVIEKFSVPS